MLGLRVFLLVSASRFEGVRPLFFAQFFVGNSLGIYLGGCGLGFRV